ncbi:MAG: molybdenum cofactor synthesis domain protein [uncultured archaeon A07HR60]|jgi:molybdenum cofactor synthesis domain|nr:MAG: molybdenum cofactor synthesis domain protein [uncultured archaeon A07HR60]
MEVALVTVGDELLAGDTENTNATWLADRLSARGASVERILVVPDDRETIASHVTTYAETFDAVIVTGGIGGTPDDVTLEAVADAFDRSLAVNDRALDHVKETLREIEDRLPEIDLDVETEASIPAGARPLLNEVGLAPGCVIEGVYVFPGIPEELRGMFEGVVAEFSGDVVSKFLYTTEPEANLIPTLREVEAELDVGIGCYPDRDAGHNRLKISATDDAALTDASTWLLERVDASETPVERDWSA